MTTLTRITVIMTVHNRSATTESCLSRLDQAAARANVLLRRVVVDDGSTDQTAEVLARLQREGDCIIRGSGNLFWAGGMRRAMAEIGDPEEFDQLLLLNDDAVLYEDALITLLDTAEGRLDQLVVGRFVDPISKVATYGGYNRHSRLRRLTFAPEHRPDSGPIAAMNANAVLVGRRAYEQLGAFDARFTHALADFDYALRARQQGLAVRLSHAVVGECPRNAVQGSWRDRALPRRERLRKMLSPKGLPPKEWALFCWRHGGLLGLPYIVAPWLTLLAPRAHKAGSDERR